MSKNLQSAVYKYAPLNPVSLPRPRLYQTMSGTWYWHSVWCYASYRVRGIDIAYGVTKVTVYGAIDFGNVVSTLQKHRSPAPTYACSAPISGGNARGIAALYGGSVPIILDEGFPLAFMGEVLLFMGATVPLM
eukprot:3006107-Rhodomonas_salina.2